MKKRAITLRSVILLLVACLLPMNLVAKDGDPDIKPKQRLVAATKILKNKSSTVAVYVKGLVCSSCGIGVKIHLRKLKGVNKSQKNKGVSLDINTQLATITLKPGASISNASIGKAVKKAGYEAALIYKWNGSKVISSTIPK